MNGPSELLYHKPIMQHSSMGLKQILQLYGNASTTNLMHVTAIQANPEVAFRKLPSIEFLMFYFIMSKSGLKAL